MGRIGRLLLVAGLVLPALATAAAGDDPCAGFNWDVHSERALFAQTPQALDAGRTPAAAPQLRAQRLYQLQLAPQAEVRFARAPARAHAGYAGVVRTSVSEAGLYRIALGDATWVDVVADGELLTVRGFQGQHGCSAPHKILEFELPAHTALLLQLSGARESSVRLGLTRAPRAAS